MMSPFRLPPETHVGQAILQVSELDRSRKFYEEVLGFHNSLNIQGGAKLSARPAGPTLLTLQALPQALPKPPRSTGLFHIAIRYPTRKSLGRALFRLLQARWPLSGFSDHKVSEAVYLADPDGLGLELCADKPRQVWPRKNGMIAMVTDPLNVESLLQEAGEPPLPDASIDPAADIGHVHLQVSKLEAARLFYEGQLGLEVMQEDYPGALFLAAGGYHHHVGLNIWAGPEARRPPAEAVGLLAYSLVLPDREVVADLRTRLQAAGAEIEEHDEGQWSVRDPDGVRVEIAPAG